MILAFLQFLPSGQEGDFEIIDGDGGSWATVAPPSQVGIMHEVN